jgi:hypothetical protein
MSQQIKPQEKGWTKPELTRLGRLVDVAPGPPGVGQGSNNRS